MRQQCFADTSGNIQKNQDGSQSKGTVKVSHTYTLETLLRMLPSCGWIHARLCVCHYLCGGRTFVCATAPWILAH